MKGCEKTRSPEMVFDDFKGRRAGIIKALSTDFAEFHKQCHPDKDNMCLYGLPGGGWEVNLPAEEEPPGFPEPVLGINFARDGMVAEDWLTLIAAHSDAWLLSLAFFVGTKCGFGRADRSRLFNMINDLPTVMEEVIGAKKQQKEKPSVSNRSSSKSKSSSKWALETRGELSKSQPKGEVGEDEEAGGLDEEKDGEHDETFCGACGEKYVSDEFWICCDICEKWYHGKCVKITPARAEHIKQYKCPSCSPKRVRP